MLKHALNYIKLGLPVFPLIPKSKKPIRSWKEFQKRLPTEQEVKEWFNQNPNINIAWATGDFSRKLVLDIDSEEALIFAKAKGLPKTPTVKTGKGYQLIFNNIGGARNFQKRSDLPGIDLRAEGGYVVAPPSIHPSGKTYQWVDGLGLEDVPIADLPDWVLAKNNSEKQLLSELENGVGEGERNNALARLAGKWFWEGLSLEDVLEKAQDWNLNNTPPLKDEDVVRTVKSIWNKDQESKALNNEIKSFNDIYNAELFASMHKDYLLWCPSMREWKFWNGTKWEAISQDEVKKFAIDTVKELQRIPNNNERFQAHVKSSGMDSKLNGMLNVARSMLAIKEDVFDRDLNLFNCKNGYINLETGEFFSPIKDKFFTKVAGCNYDPEIECPLWIKFLNEIFQFDNDLIEFIQLAVGYALSGLSSEQAFFILYGTGQNGKSTFLDTLEDLFCDYGCHLPTYTLTVKNFNSNTNDIARLFGSRFVNAVESGHSNKLDEVLVKQLTGGDKVTSRFLYKEFIDFRPTFKIFLATNHKPVIKGTDFGIWRRIKLIPFSYQVSEENKDPDLKEKLKKELPGILNWAIKGAVNWHLFGLSEPQAVKYASGEYQKEEDWIGQVLEDHLLFDKKYVITSSRLLEIIHRYSGLNTLINSKDLKSYMVSKGFKWEKASSGLEKGSIVWLGIGLRIDAFNTVNT